MTGNYSRGFRDALILILAITVLLFLINLCYRIVNYEPKPRPTPEQQMEDTIPLLGKWKPLIYSEGPLKGIVGTGGDTAGNSTVWYEGKVIAYKGIRDSFWTVYDTLRLDTAIGIIRKEHADNAKKEVDSL